MCPHNAITSTVRRVTTVKPWEIKFLCNFVLHKQKIMEDMIINAACFNTVFGGKSLHLNVERQCEENNPMCVWGVLLSL